VTSLRSRRVDLNQFLRSFAKRYGVSGGDTLMSKHTLKTLVEELNRLAGDS
jgi:hypothetical protein